MDGIEQVKELRDTTKPLSMRSLTVFSGLGAGDVAALQPEWVCLPFERRLEVIKALVSLAEDNVDLDFNELFLYCLHDEESVIRAMAVDGLWEDERSATLHRLLRMMEDPVSEVRASVMMSLSRFAYLAEIGDLRQEDADTLCNALLKVIGDQSQPLEVRRRAIESIGYFSNVEQVQTEIGKAYAHPEQMMRESALVAMGRSMQPAWFPCIQRELRSTSPALRYEAARAVGELAEDGQVLLEGLVPLLHDDDMEVVLAAIWALGEVNGPQAVRILQHLANNGDKVRSQAASEVLEEMVFDE